MSISAEYSTPMLNIHQRFIFNLNWSPEMFSEISQDVDTLIDSGELDLF